MTQGAEKRFEVQVRVDTPQEAEYYRNGGILPLCPSATCRARR